ncbi:hypothetical protein Hanom_Chr07g00579881 [Helianthus anomalus]
MWLAFVLVLEYITSCEWRSWSSEQRKLLCSTSLSCSTSCLLHYWPSWELSDQGLAQVDWL